MSDKFKKEAGLLSAAVLLLVLLAVCAYLYFAGVFAPSIRLQGPKRMQLQIHEPYVEPGFTAKWRFNDISSSVLIQNQIDTSKLSVQKIIYQFGNTHAERIVEIIDTLPPELTLIGEEQVIVFRGEAYEEKGIEIADNSKEDCTSSLLMRHELNVNEIGDTVIEYQASDASGNKAVIHRRVKIVENPSEKKLFYHYGDIDNTLQSWWFHKAKDHLRKPPSFDVKKMQDYNAVYLGNDEKVVYLTYDEGGNDITYIKEIAEILNQHQIPATFFFTRNYILSEAEFMKTLVNSGHIIANHTQHHYRMSDFANEQGIDTFVREIEETQKSIYAITQQAPPMIFRFPKGEYSERSLAIVKDLGYQSVFWSHAYHDYGGDVSKEEAYNNLVTHLHPGVIYLLHPANKGNLDSLEAFIEEVQKQGYRFDLVTSIQNGAFPKDWKKCRIGE